MENEDYLVQREAELKKEERNTFNKRPDLSSQGKCISGQRSRAVTAYQAAAVLNHITSIKIFYILFEFSQEKTNLFCTVSALLRTVQSDVSTI